MLKSCQRSCRPRLTHTRTISLLLTSWLNQSIYLERTIIDSARNLHIFQICIQIFTYLFYCLVTHSYFVVKPLHPHCLQAGPSKGFFVQSFLPMLANWEVTKSESSQSKCGKIRRVENSGELNLSVKKRKASVAAGGQALCLLEKMVLKNLASFTANIGFPGFFRNASQFPIYTIGMFI